MITYSKYQVLSGATISALEVAVNSALDRGCEPIGTLSVIETPPSAVNPTKKTYIYHQAVAMVKR